MYKYFIGVGCSAVETLRGRVSYELNGTTIANKILYRFGTEAQITCHGDYTLHGNSTRICSSTTGLWDGSSSCVKSGIVFK